MSPLELGNEREVEPLHVVDKSTARARLRLHTDPVMEAGKKTCRI